MTALAGSCWWLCVHQDAKIHPPTGQKSQTLTSQPVMCAVYPSLPSTHQGQNIYCLKMVCLLFCFLRQADFKEVQPAVSWGNQALSLRTEPSWLEAIALRSPESPTYHDRESKVAPSTQDPDLQAEFASLGRAREPGMVASCPHDRKQRLQLIPPVPQTEKDQLGAL